MGEKDYPTLHWHDLLKRVADSRSGQTIVEIGASTGADTRELEKLGATVIAVDIKPDYLRTAREQRDVKHPSLLIILIWIAIRVRNRGIDFNG